MWEYVNNTERCDVRRMFSVSPNVCVLLQANYRTSLWNSYFLFVSASKNSLEWRSCLVFRGRARWHGGRVKSRSLMSVVQSERQFSPCGKYPGMLYADDCPRSPVAHDHPCLTRLFCCCWSDTRPWHTSVRILLLIQVTSYRFHLLLRITKYLI